MRRLKQRPKTPKTTSPFPARPRAKTHYSRKTTASREDIVVAIAARGVSERQYVAEGRKLPTLQPNRKPTMPKQGKNRHKNAGWQITVVFVGFAWAADEADAVIQGLDWVAQFNHKPTRASAHRNEHGQNKAQSKFGEEAAGAWSSQCEDSTIGGWAVWFEELLAYGSQKIKRIARKVQFNDPALRAAPPRPRLIIPKENH